MKFDDVKEKLNKAIKTFIERDEYLLENDVNERSMTHKLAEYLQDEFEDYNVDCEYNKNCATAENSKRISFIEEESKIIEKLKKKDLDNYFIKEEFYEVSVYPDIIVHKRGNEEDNLLIIEVKKANSTIAAEEYDLIKLKKYTNDEFHDSLDYKYGVFLTLSENIIDKNDFIWYKRGKEFNHDSKIRKI